jgi:hypothetical protein
MVGKWSEDGMNEEAAFRAWMSAEDEQALSLRGIAEQNRHLLERQYNLRVVGRAVDLPRSGR